MRATHSTDKGQSIHKVSYSVHAAYIERLSIEAFCGPCLGANGEDNFRELRVLLITLYAFIKINNDYSPSKKHGCGKSPVRF